MANYATFSKEGLKKVSENNYKVWMCIICGWVYEEEKGAPEEGIEPGTRWEDIPEDWEDAFPWEDGDVDLYPADYIPSPLEALAEQADDEA